MVQVYIPHVTGIMVVRPEQDLHRHVAEHPRPVDGLPHRCVPVGVSSVGGEGTEGFEVGAAVGPHLVLLPAVAAGISRVVEVAGPALRGGLVEPTLPVVRPDPADQHVVLLLDEGVEAVVERIDLQPGEARPARRQVGGAEEPIGEGLGEGGGVLDLADEIDRLEAVVALSVHEVVEADAEARLAGERLEGAVSLQADPDTQAEPAVREGALHIGRRSGEQGVPGGFVEGEADRVDLVVGEEEVPGELRGQHLDRGVGGLGRRRRSGVCRSGAGGVALRARQIRAVRPAIHRGGGATSDQEKHEPGVERRA
jgi:hypothetical protein